MREADLDMCVVSAVVECCESSVSCRPASRLEQILFELNIVASRFHTAEIHIIKMLNAEYDTLIGYLKAVENTGGAAGTYPPHFTKDQKRSLRRAAKEGYTLQNGKLFKLVREVLY